MIMNLTMKNMNKSIILITIEKKFDNNTFSSFYIKTFSMSAYERFQQKQEANALLKSVNDDINLNILKQARKVCEIRWNTLSALDEVRWNALDEVRWSALDEYTTDIYWADGSVLLYDKVYRTYLEDSSAMTIREVIAKHAKYPLQWNHYSIRVENVSFLDQKVCDAELCHITVTRDM